MRRIHIQEFTMSLRKVCGVVLGSLIAMSAALAVLGIWGAVSGETVWKLLGTFFVVGLTTIGMSYVANSFFGSPPLPPTA